MVDTCEGKLAVFDQMKFFILQYQVLKFVWSKSTKGVTLQEEHKLLISTSTNHEIGLL